MIGPTGPFGRGLIRRQELEATNGCIICWCEKGVGPCSNCAWYCCSSEASAIKPKRQNNRVPGVSCFFFCSLGFPMTSKGEPSSTVRARGLPDGAYVVWPFKKRQDSYSPALCCALLRSAAPVTTAANQRSTYTLLNFHTQSADPDFLLVTLNSTCLGGLLLQNGGNSNKLFPLGRRLKQTRKKKNIFAFLRQINSMPHQPRPLFFSSPI